MRYLLLFIMSLCMAMNVAENAYGQQSDCELLYEKIIKKSLQTTSGMRIMDYGVTLVSRKTKGAKENRVKVYSNVGHRYVITDQVQVYVDSVCSIMMVPISKSILINDTDPKSKPGLKLPDASFADSLFHQTVDIISCKEIAGNGSYDREMIVKPKNASMGFSQVVYWIKSTDLSIYKVVLTYVNGDYSRVEYTFYQNVVNPSNEKMNQPVLDLFFKKDKIILPAYKGYRITDNRIISLKN